MISASGQWTETFLANNMPGYVWHRLPGQLAMLEPAFHSLTASTDPENGNIWKCYLYFYKMEYKKNTTFVEMSVKYVMKDPANPLDSG